MSSENTSRSRAPGRWALAAGAALTALLLALSFPPAGIAFLAWVGIVPLLLVLGRANGKRSWLTLGLAGWAFGIAGFFWARHVTVGGMILLGFYLSLYFLLFCAIVRWLSCRRRMPLAFSVPLAWVSLEVARGLLLTGLPMLLLAHTQYKMLRVVQIADLAGTAGVTFWIAAVNGLLADIVLHLRQPRPRSGWRRVLPAAVFVLVISTFALWYGSYRLNTIVTTNGPSIALIQCNIPQEVKNHSVSEEDIFFRHVKRTRGAQAGTPPDLVIWPETMTPWGMFGLKYEARIRELDAVDKLADAEYYRQRLRGTAAWRAMLRKLQERSSLLIGAGTVTMEDGRLLRRNSALLLPEKARGERTRYETLTRYDKIHLVPFGEYVPLKPLIGWVVGPFIPYKDGLTPGESRTLFDIDGSRFAVLICFEDMFPRLVAEFARGESKPDFIVNITNEGWFKDGAEVDLHLAVAVFRAIECRAGFVRSANTGISAFVSPTGRIVSTLTVGGRDREVAGVLRGHAMSTDARSPYLTVGESFGWLCVAACGLSLAAAAWPGAKLLLLRRRAGR